MHDELLAMRTGSSYVFAAYTPQLRDFYAKSVRPGTAKMINDTFNPTCVSDWFHERLVDWSKSLPKGRACTHIFRKTSLQYARRGEDASRRVAEDARGSESVLMTHYVEVTDPELREASNRIYQRIRASLPPVVARRYGDTFTQMPAQALEEELQMALATKDWNAVVQLSARLAGNGQQTAS